MALFSLLTAKPLAGGSYFLCDDKHAGTSSPSFSSFYCFVLFICFVCGVGVCRGVCDEDV